MQRLHVQKAQLGVCIQKHMYAFGKHRPNLRHGELLLLQLVKREAEPHRRINFALVFDHMKHDDDGTISRQHWPTEDDHTWPWIMYGSATVPTIPFSLEDLPLSGRKRYDSQANPVTIERVDEEIIMPYIQGSLAAVPLPTRQSVALLAIYNHDRIVRAAPRKTVNVEKCVPNPFLAEILKSYYEHHCQICGKDCSSDYYGVAFSETHHIQDLAQGGLDISGNIVVLCPDHHRIIHATNAHFNHQGSTSAPTYEYPNGLRESLIRFDHFKDALQYSVP